MHSDGRVYMKYILKAKVELVQVPMFTLGLRYSYTLLGLPTSD